MIIQRPSAPSYLLTSNRILFGNMEFDVLQIQTDPDHFRLKVSGSPLPGSTLSPIETLTMGSLEMYSQYLGPMDEFATPTCYFINLHTQAEIPETYVIEADYLQTSDDILYAEAYCYDDRNRLVGKGGYVWLKK